MEYLELASLPIISTIVFTIIDLLKKAINKEKFNNFIPLLSGVLGVVLGIMLFYIEPQMMPASSVLMAAILGGASGLSATGTHQIFKQIKK